MNLLPILKTYKIKNWSNLLKFSIPFRIQTINRPTKIKSKPRSTKFYTISKPISAILIKPTLTSPHSTPVLPTYPHSKISPTNSYSIIPYTTPTRTKNKPRISISALYWRRQAATISFNIARPRRRSAPSIPETGVAIISTTPSL